MALSSVVAVIGGGPAGLLAAQRLAEAGHRVAVYEAQATVGRKFLVAGHGGFNLTNAEDTATFESRYGQKQLEFGGFLRHFSPTDLRQWASSLGIDTFVGTSGRIFPLKVHKPADVLRAWVSHLHDLGVTMHTRHRWLGFVGSKGLRLRDETTGHEFDLFPDATVLALGGASWSKTGSDGRWVAAFEQIGVQCVPFAPSNCGAEVAWSPFFQTKVGRAPLKNIALRCGPQRVRGELLLTEYGLEGTPVYALSACLRAALVSGAPALLHLDLKPDLSDEQLTAKLQKLTSSRSLPDFLRQTLRLGPPVYTLLREVAPHALTTTPEALAGLLRNVPLPVQALRPLDEAISSAGGVAWTELTDELMLRGRPGTFLAGEMLDWEAPTGGYLLQGCFSTGAWAAHGVVRWLS
ncbi:TIGR03862 family flavoprotein [Hymenobacter sp. YC55]|uniref:TIGR03862 family flavoprotein n=1 Tax=Hymenobacter sp. YC55 TaxID=3034019 RepID=UPI0023F936EF|nr:TIGR03862 family flavoprotein [Hymenobacter sp. YC55]MDF7811886.1 TIGR03862 family flavoprotein [Hymenobacter sp. YC55]